MRPVRRVAAQLCFGDHGEWNLCATRRAHQAQGSWATQFFTALVLWRHPQFTPLQASLAARVSICAANSRPIVLKRLASRRSADKYIDPVQ